MFRKKITWHVCQAVRVVRGLGGGSPAVLRINCSVADGEQRTEQASPSSFLSFPAGFWKSSFSSFSSFPPHGGTAFIPSIQGQLGADQTLLPSKLCQSRISLEYPNKSWPSHHSQWWKTTSNRRKPTMSPDNHPSLRLLLKLSARQTHIKSKCPWRWLPSISK